jgi:RNA polymerase sigma-70 factor (ECF subfamily)
MRYAGNVSARAAPTFEQVFRENAACVFRVLRWLGVREPDIPDVCQEVFLVVHRRFATFDGRSAMRTWLYGICRRVASEYRRAPHLLREELCDTLPEQSQPAPQDAEMERRAARRLLDEILDTLDEDKRFVFVLHEIEQVPMDEIAALVGCPLQTAYSRHRAATKHVEAAVRRLQRYAA